MQIAGSTANEIFESIRLLVLSGSLKSGDALPPVRDLAAHLGVNRNTVAGVYKRLSVAGIALTQGRYGTTICAPAGKGEQEGRIPGSPLVDVASGNPNPQWLPALSTLIGAFKRAPCLYGDPTVNAGLAEIAKNWIAGDCPEAYELNLTHGAVDAIERLAAAHLIAGDQVAVEEPCFLGTINALRIAGMRAVGVAIDGEGMRPEGLEAALKGGAKAVLITPRAHNPTGCSLTPERAQALGQVIARYPQALVIVDDHFALLADSAYHSVLMPDAARWALIRSMSKALGPDLRLAFVASDPETSRRLQQRLSSGMTWVSHILQDVVEACLRSSAVARQIASARSAYAMRRRELVAALRAHGIAADEPPDGFNVWIPTAGDGRSLVHGMTQRGWLLRAGDAFAVQRPVRGVRITVSMLEDGQAQQLCGDLRQCLSERANS